MSSAAFLVYVAAVLFYKPIFTQPLGFFLCAAGAVEKFATDGTVSVVYLRDSIGISKINAAFLTGQQIDRIGEIEDEHLLSALEKLSDEDLELLTLYIYEGYSTVELSKAYGIAHQNISKRIIKITNFLKNF